MTHIVFRSLDTIAWSGVYVTRCYSFFFFIIAYKNCKQKKIDIKFSFFVKKYFKPVKVETEEMTRGTACCPMPPRMWARESPEIENWVNNYCVSATLERAVASLQPLSRTLIDALCEVTVLVYTDNRFRFDLNFSKYLWTYIAKTL